MKVCVCLSLPVMVAPDDVKFADGNDNLMTGPGKFRARFLFAVCSYQIPRPVPSLSHAAIRQRHGDDEVL